MLAPIQIDKNWNALIDLIQKNFEGHRREALLAFYNTNENRIKNMPASSKKQYHSCFEGGYVHHVLNVVNAGLKLHEVWKSMGTLPTYDLEELVFACLNHDLGKMGDEDQPYYIKNTSEWHIKNQGALYNVNPDLQTLMPVPHRSLFLLQSNNIPVTSNEMIAIMTHDGLYSEGNKEYLMGYNKPVSSLCYIIHQADMMASRIEYEQQTLAVPETKTSTIAKFSTRKTKKDIQAELLNGKDMSGFKNVLNNIK